MARRQRVRTGREGAVPGIIVNAALLYLANVWPGWSIVPFLTPSTSQVMGAVNAAWIAGLVANAVYLVAGMPLLRALGEIVVLIFGIVAAFRIWDVFPFDFSGSSFDWALVARILLVIGIAGSFIGIIAQIVALGRAAAGLGKRS
ncbi:hypothetical protein RBS60_01735 [Sinomonas sp. ASV486]|uniref:hypothetical protein n=1 Tax=Sinomonas sp. ASV486 TaxID=3051170 RepID=UPI0027DB8AB0|nr:hypothetical protein [Sinomonas sp. ASV486]MDQ4488914.1 hypothetical protein [Sinomonas sp. ASV486]